uniref:Uncharacterized protein n=1 Tax=Lactuca sativa TaxID=4236 RepID=A0A9R1XXH0_LACSA|nr:hypothetical protein LSAT_V11C100000360 [Lactuca sativa]
MRMHDNSFKHDSKEDVKKLCKNEFVQKRRKNKEGNVGKARKVPKVVANDAEDARRIQVRTSQNVLYICIHNLSEEHKSYISSIGMWHLLNMKVDGCASIMGHYTVRNFDSDRMVLNLHHGDIPINWEVIHELLGLPLGNVAIKSMAYRQVTDDTIIVWKKQFEDEDNIRPRAVQQAIMQTTRAYLLFKVNIFVLLCNTLESVRCDSVKIVRARPTICFWNVDKLRERERVECRTIGLGMGELQDPFQVINESDGYGNVVQENIQELINNRSSLNSVELERAI